jgi:transposase
MERLEAKKIHGHTYYYYSCWEWRQGKSRRIWQKYLGKLQDIVQAVAGNGRAPLHAEIFRWGLPEALWRQCQQLDLVHHIERLCPKRTQGLSVGEYLVIAALNRAMEPRSKRSLWEWFGNTTLLRHFPQANQEALSSQRFWDHMHRLSQDTALSIWKELLQRVVQQERVDLSSISYDGTKFYTFLDTFNTRCPLARRGKNKQGRNNLRQISYALFCAADGPLPLFYDVYAGNRNDAKQFPLMLRRFREFFRDVSSDPQADPEVTLIFDKGNNSKDNFALLDDLPLSYVGSVKLGEHKDLAEIPRTDARFTTSAHHPTGTTSLRVRKQVYGKERILVVTYNPKLFEAQWLTLSADVARALERLEQLRGGLENRRQGLVRTGRAPTLASVQKQCRALLRRPYLTKLIEVQISVDAQGLPLLEWTLSAAAEQEVCAKYLGKNILITDREHWNDGRVIRAYRSQYLIEGVFQEMKDREVGSWWPLHHWTESKIHVHALYCTLAVLLRGLLRRQVEQGGMPMSLKRLWRELDDIREVVTIYEAGGKRRKAGKQTVLSKTTPLQRKLMTLLGLAGEKESG